MRTFHGEVWGILLCLPFFAQGNNCDPNGGTYSVSNLDDLAAYPDLAGGDCTVIRGNVQIICDAPEVAIVNGGALSNLNMFSKVSQIDGFLQIENCNVTSLEGLSSLRTIEGTPAKGLQITACNNLADVKGIEDLRTINNGGVNIVRNNKLCYIDLMPWDQIVKTTSGTTTTEKRRLIEVLISNSSCSILSCDASCYCGYCGGPGSCSDQGDCESKWTDVPNWVDDEGTKAAYGIIIFVSVLVVTLVLVVTVGCARGDIYAKMHVTTVRPPPSQVVALRPIGIPNRRSSSFMQSTAQQRGPPQGRRTSEHTRAPAALPGVVEETPPSRQSNDTHISLPRLRTDGGGATPGQNATHNDSAGEYITVARASAEDTSRASHDDNTDEFIAPAREGAGKSSPSHNDSAGEYITVAGSPETPAATVVPSPPTSPTPVTPTTPGKLRPKDVTIHNAPPAIKAQAVELFAPHKATLEALEATASGDDAAAVAALKGARLRTHGELQAARKAARAAVEGTAAGDAAAKKAAVSDLIAARLAIQLLQEMIKQATPPQSVNPAPLE